MQILQALADLVANSSRSNINRVQSRSSYRSNTDDASLANDFVDILDKANKSADKLTANLRKQISLREQMKQQLEQEIKDMESVDAQFYAKDIAQRKKRIAAYNGWQTKQKQQVLEIEQKQEEQVANAVAKYKENLRKNFTIQEHAEEIKKQQQRIANELEVYEKKKALLGDITSAEKEAYQKLNEEKVKQDKRYDAIQKSLAREGSRSERYSRYTSEVNRIREEQRAQEALNRVENAEDPAARRARSRQISQTTKEAIHKAADLYGIGAVDARGGGVANVVGNVANVISGGPRGIVSAIEGFLGRSSPIVAAIMQVLKIVGSINSVVSTGIQKAVNAQSTYMGSINARLQQTQNDNTDYYSDMLHTFSNIAGTWTSFVNKTTYIEKLSDLVQSGIAYNAEERALIASLADRMVYTFDALDANLTRLIRIQQRDLTYSALGSEALLTEFLNREFKDTSYLNNMYDQVSGILLDATAKMTADQGAAFSYEVQKWLGSLYSVGLSESGVQQLAQGLTYLATGDVSQLTSNQQLQYIYAAAAEQGGMSLADILVSGMDLDTTNELLKNVVSLLSNVYSTSGTNPVQAAWAGITGMSISDLRSVQNLNQYMASISESHASWVDQVKETENQLNLVMQTSRTSEAMSIENLISNALFSVGQNMLDDEYADTLLNRWLGINGTSKYLGYYLGSQVGGLAGTIMQSASTLPAITKALSEGVGDIIDNLGKGNNVYQVTGRPLTNLLSYVSNDLIFDTSNNQSAVNDYLSSLAAYEQLIAQGGSGMMTADEFDSFTRMIQAQASATGSVLPALAENAEAAVQYAQTYANESTEDRALLSEAVDVQDYLFENEQTIRVTLALIEDRAASRLAESLHIDSTSEDLAAIKATVQNKVNVDLIDNDVNALLNGIQSVRWSM